MASRLLPLRRLSRLLLLKPPSSNFRTSSSLLLEASRSLHLSDTSHGPLHWIASRSFCSSPPLNLNEGPAAIDYSSVLQEDEFHKLADSTIHDLQEKFEGLLGQEYGDSVQVDGFDIDYGNEVLTLKLGDLGTYVLNKQTPNRQIWLSSPVSGPFRFDWDRDAEAWIYRRTKVKLLTLLESEMEQLCGEAISLS
ncbi:frataxin, mitochondrial isoform X1 [Rosa chinensis]|uniref:frataxin, mitochondrial isoform X1 n=1 Tax=Rosa chinensis TaxID=74649 RepID=UPI001AD8F6F5|nr:frataxin, mitochondrial isoform X1 [Rosa chinensis]XP_040369069.1 frataxin, mitochondrial isoform X1 [Rosa chinensis]